MKHASLLFAVLMSSMTGLTAPRPNFIIFFTDDQGYNDVGCYGSPQIKTPNFDRMAREGMRFTDFYAQPVCGPSRAALMTGCYPIRVGEPGNGKAQHNVLHANEVTIAEVLKSAGYVTALIGKWHLAGGHRELMPNGQGFDYFYGTPLHNGFTRTVSHKSFKTQIVRNGDVLVNALDQEGMNNLTKTYTDEALSFIRRSKDRPFFLYLAHNMPHVPLGASDAFRGKSPRGLYGDVIQELDWSAGEVLRTLQEEGLDASTLVVFTSDNGPWIEGHLGDYGGCADPLRGWKMSAWEGGARVPCIVRWPGHVPTGKVSNELVTTMDLLPTFAALAGAALPPDRVLDGRDVSELLLGRQESLGERTFYTYNWVRLNAVRKGKWKLVLPRKAKPEGTGWSGRMIDAVSTLQLYDLGTDISEQVDVAGDHPEVVAGLMKLVDAARKELGDFDRVGDGCRFFDGEPPETWSERGTVPPPRAVVHPKPVGNLHFNFEGESAKGWRVISGDVTCVVTDLRPLYQQGDDGREGTFLLHTLSRTKQWDGGDQHTAVLESPAFRLTGGSLSFLLGGGKHDGTHVVLVDARTGEELKRVSGPGAARMIRVNWDVGAWLEDVVRLRVVDSVDHGPWGHVTVDDISVAGDIVADVSTPFREQPRVFFQYTDVPGVGKEDGVCRRDPSDVIQVGRTCYVWYSKTTRERKLYPSGYNATVWYATSEDEGRTWVERGEAVGLGVEGFDAFGVFTPNILVADGKYYLFYTAVAHGFLNRGYSDGERTAIGLAVADTPAGPWRKVARNPVFASSRDPKKFDSFRVDDVCFIRRAGQFWMYYKGRQWENTPGHTKMGVAVADAPGGPYRRMNDGDPVQDSGHEVLVWPQSDGVMSLVSATGPQGRTLQLARDGIQFEVVCSIPGNYPRAPGVLRTDLTDPKKEGAGVSWGISMVHGRDPYLVRYRINYQAAAPKRDDG